MFDTDELVKAGRKMISLKANKTSEKTTELVTVEFKIPQSLYDEAQAILTESGLLDRAIHDTAMDVPCLGYYFAALLSDKESLVLQDEDKPPLIGMGHCTDAEIDKLLDISDILIAKHESL